MSKVIMLFAAAAVATLSSTSVFAIQQPEELIQACEQQNANASDRYAAVSLCLDEAVQYEIPEPGKGGDDE